MPAKKLIDLEKLKKDYACGRSLNSLQAEYNCTRPTLAKYLKKAGVEVKSNNYRYSYTNQSTATCICCKKAETSSLRGFTPICTKTQPFFLREKKRFLASSTTSNLAAQ